MHERPLCLSVGSKIQFVGPGNWILMYLPTCRCCTNNPAFATRIMGRVRWGFNSCILDIDLYNITLKHQDAKVTCFSRTAQALVSRLKTQLRDEARNRLGPLGSPGENLPGSFQHSCNKALYEKANDSSCRKNIKYIGCINWW